MNRKILVPLFLLVGLLLLLLGWAWARITPTAALWNDEQAQEYTDAALALHGAAHSHEEGEKHDHGQEAALAAEQEQRLDAARERFANIQGDLEAARNNRNLIAEVLQTLGIAAVLSGVLLHFISRHAT